MRTVQIYADEATQVGNFYITTGQTGGRQFPNTDMHLTSIWVVQTLNVPPF